MQIQQSSKRQVSKEYNYCLSTLESPSTLRKPIKGGIPAEDNIVIRISNAKYG